jgi:hypothetical protein
MPADHPFYDRVSADYFAKRGLRRYAGVASLWALGVGAVISGHYSGWNLAKGDPAQRGSGGSCSSGPLASSRLIAGSAALQCRSYGMETDMMRHWSGAPPAKNMSALEARGPEDED